MKNNPEIDYDNLMNDYWLLKRFVCLYLDSYMLLSGHQLRIDRLFQGIRVRFKGTLSNELYPTFSCSLIRNPHLLFINMKNTLNLNGCKA